MGPSLQVTSRATDMVRKVAAEAGLSLARLVEGLDVPVSEIEKPRDGCSWDDFALLCDRLLAALGPNGMRDAGRGFLEIPKVGPFARIGAIFASPRMFYWSGAKFSPNMFSAVTTEYRVVGPTEVEIQIAIKPGSRDSAGFFHFNAGVFVVMPKMIGLPDSIVDVTITDHKAVYRIVHPPTLSIWRRIKHVFVALTSVQGAYAELEAQNQDLLVRVEELRQARAAADAASTMKSRFMANMSHEIRTPLNGILGMVDLAYENARDPEMRGQLETIRKSASSLLEIVGDVLDFSRLDAKKLSLRVAELDVRQLVEDLVASFQPEAKAKNVPMVAVVAPDCPRTVVGDAGRLRQVLANLISNGLKFTTSGFVTLRVQPVTGESALRFEVEDSGIGIQPGWHDRLFNPFVQVDDSLTRSTGGAGLGLAICKQLVELMSGKIDFQSELGRGTRFWITIPLQISAPTPIAGNHDVELLAPAQRELPAPQPLATAEVAPRAPASPTAAVAPVPANGAVRFLVVEDNLVNQKVLVGMLKRLGYPVDVAVNGQEAVDAVGRAHYALIFMDCQMPVKDGFQATREIRMLLPQAEQPRIIAITAHAMDGYKEQCLGAGMDDYLSKPVGRKELEATISRHLQLLTTSSAAPQATA